VTASAVSYQVKALEERIGVKLFERRPHSLVLTEAGRTLVPALASTFDAIEDALQRLAEPPKPYNTVTIAMPASFATGWLLPRLADFRSNNRNVEIRPRSSSHLLEPGIEGVDAAIRQGHAGWGALDCVFLFAVELVPICSPDYLESRIQCRAAPSLSGQLLLASESTPEIWNVWEHAKGAAVEPERVLLLGDDGLVMQAALNGTGIALMDRQLVAKWIGDGRLVIPFDASSCRCGDAWFLVFEESRRYWPPIAAIRDWLLEEVVRREP
jgi:LysR family transcriptional regulator, glycine cleavage system transcriptional activator